MLAFEVKDMSCNHCVGAITRAIHEVDPAVTVKAELETHRVLVDAAATAATAVEAAIREAGYTPVRQVDVGAAPGAAGARGCGGGCGCR